MRDQLVAVGEVQPGLAAHGLEDLRQVVGADDLGAEAAVLVRELLDLLEADVVDLLGGLRRGGELAQCCGVRRVAVGHPAQAAPVVRSAEREDLVAQHVAVGPQTGTYVALDHLTQPALPGIDVQAVGRRGGGQQRVVRDRLRQQAVELLNGVGGGEGGREPPGGHAVALALRELAVVATEPAQLVDERLGHVGVGQREHAHQDRHRDLRAEDRVSGHLREAGLHGVGAGGRVGDQHVPGDPLLVGEVGLVGRRGARREVAHRGDLAVLRLPGGLLEMAGTAVVTEQVGMRGSTSR